MNKISFIIFLLIVFSFYFGFHYYIYHRIANGLMLSIKIRFYLKLFLIIGSLTFIAAEFSKRIAPTYWIAYLGAVWFGVIVISFSVFIIKDIIQLLIPDYRKALTHIGLFVIFFTAIYSIYNAARPIYVKNIRLKLSRWPSELKDFSIVQLSDLHIGILTTFNKIESIIKKVNSLKPDLIVITGDLIDQNICNSEKFCSILKRLNSKHGVYAVTGNHEFYAGVEKFEELAKMTGITLLRNRKVTIADSIELVGIDDSTIQRFGMRKPDVELVIKKCDTKKPIILLNHSPVDFQEAVDIGVDLQLSGHTHAGQLPPMVLLIHFIFKYSYGLYKYKSSYIYTTSGTGTWGPPMRLFSRSKIVKFTFE